MQYMDLGIVKGFSMIGIVIMPHELTSTSSIILSTLSLKEAIEEFVQLVYSAANHSYNLIPF